MEHYFIGIKVEGKAADTAVSLQQDLRLKDYFKQLPVKEDLHLTLLFLGGWDTGKRQKLWSALQDMEFSSFKLYFDQYAFFGKKEYPRVLFLRPHENEMLMNLYNAVSEEAFSLDYPVPSKPFRPHLTIAKKYKGNRPFPFPVYGEVEETVEAVTEMSLFKVRPQESPKYEKVSTIFFR
ncbi:MAG: RNA 2',3'-cyclic phosphodiesterase [Alkalicoccus sp.]|nr:MAG: RNA 2',3'-cyclic phosphodiesterase [Alkalicoccus sp.]